VAGVRQQGQRVGAKSVNRFRRDEGQVERNADGKGAGVGRRAVTVAVFSAQISPHLVGRFHKTFFYPDVNRRENE